MLQCLAIFETKIQMQRIGKIFLATMVCLAVGFLSSFATQSSVKDWYPTLVKPFFNPPSWVFAPVWALLYIMMGIAAGLVWSKAMSIKAKIPAIGFFILQLGLNALWSILFFGFKNPLLALVEIILLWICIYQTYRYFYQIQPVAGKLLLPYLAWVSFALILNFSIWWLN